MKCFNFEQNVTIQRAYIKGGTCDLYVYYDFSDKHGCLKKVQILDDAHFKILKKFFGLCKNCSFTPNPESDKDLLGWPHRAPAVFANEATFYDFAAIGDSDGKNYYHIPSGKVYTLEALFDMYKLKAIDEISKEIEALTNELRKVSNLKISDVKTY